MKCRGKLLAIIAWLVFSTSLAQAAPPFKGDALLQNPNLTVQMAQQALDLYEEQLIRGGDKIVLLPRLSRTCFVLGDMAPREERAPYYDKGLAYAERLVEADPCQAAGHYWKALNLCGQADVGRRMTGFKLLPKIVAALKECLTLDETYDQAGAHRVLGRIYFEAPPWPISVGDKKKSLHHLSAAARLAPDNSTNHLYLAETLLDLKDKAQARQELEKVLQAKSHAIRPKGLEEDYREARRLLEDLKKE